jgi:hypothetical protein
MAKNNLQPGFKRYEFKSGFDGFRWGGMYTEGAPSSNPRGRPRLILNGRFYGGDIIERPGLSLFYDFAAASTEVDTLGDFQPAKSLKLWILGDGCPGVSSSVGFYLANLDQEQSPEFQRAVYYSSAVTALHIATYDNYLYVGTDADLRRLQIIRQPFGTEAISVSGTSQDTPIKTFTGFTIRCLQAFDGKLFIGLDNGAGASKIVTWDGLSFRDDITGINAPVCFGLYHAPKAGDTLVVGFAAASNHIRYRVTGDSPGTWTTKAPGAGTIASVSMATFKDKLYIADGTTGIWAFDADANTLTSVRNPGSATAVRALTTFNNLLYFGYETATSGIIGKYDGTTWTDVEKNLFTQASCTSIRTLADYRGRLWVGGIKGLNGGHIYFSPLTVTTGTYGDITPNLSFNGDIDVLMVA